MSQAPGTGRVAPLSPAAGSPAALGWVAERCIRTSPQHLGCDRCIESCPEQALVFVDSESSGGESSPRLVASDACHGCSACLPSCPTEALISPEIERVNSAVTDSVHADESLTLRCHRAAQRDSARTVHCLRGIGPDQVMAWSGDRSGKDVSLCVAEDCTQCPAAPRHLAHDGWWEAMNELGVIVREGCGPFQPSVGATFSRRDLLSGRAQRWPEIDDNDTAPRARRLQRALDSSMGISMAPPALALDTDQCDASGVCAKVCPTPALTATDTNGALYFSPSECIECGYCVSSCPQQALSLSGGDSVETVTLRQTPIMACFECGRDFAASSEAASPRARCPACERDASLFREDFRQLFG